MRICSICGEEKTEEEMENDICLECSLSILKEDEKDVGRDDFS